MALFRAVSWVIDKGFTSFEVESDSQLAIEAIGDCRKTGRWRKMVLEVRSWMVLRGIRFRHIPREVNKPT
ncbi:unnamed protein product, partial [Cuscuta europaea]